MKDGKSRVKTVRARFPDTEFGLYEPHFDFLDPGTRKHYRGVHVPYRVNGVPGLLRVVDEAMPRYAVPDSMLETVFASANDGIYWLLENALAGKCGEGETVEVVYDEPVARESEEGEGEDTMDNKTIEIPADAKTVTLELKGHGGFTLRSLLPQVKSEVELVVRDEFGTSTKPDADLYRLRAGSGNTLLCKLERSRVVDGGSLLGLTPRVRLVSPKPTLLDGSLATLTETGYIQLIVEPPARED